MQAVTVSSTFSRCIVIAKYTALSLCAGILVSCGTGSVKQGGEGQGNSAVANNSSAELLSLNIEALTHSINTNDWALRTSCRGIDYSLDAQLQFDPQSGLLTLNAHGLGSQSIENSTAILDLQLKGKIAIESASISMKGRLNNDAEAELNGIYSKTQNHIIALLSAEKFSECGSIHLFHKQKAAQFESTGFELPDIYSANNKSKRNVKPPVKAICDKALMQWLELYLSQLPAQRRFGFSYKPYVLKMYSDDVFLKYFPSSITRYTSKQLAEFAMYISQSADCPKLSDSAHAAWRAVSHLVLPLNNMDKHSRNELFLDRTALRLYESWLQGVDSSVAAVSRSTGKSSRDLMIALHSFESTMKAFEPRFSSSVFSKVEVFSKRKVIASHRKTFELKNFERELDQRLSKRSSTVDQLMELSAFPARYADYIETIAPDKKQDIQTSINVYIKESATSALSTFIEQREGIEGIQALIDWQKNYAVLAEQLSSGEKVLIAGEANKRREAIVEKLLAAARAQWQLRVLSQAKDLNTLQESIEFEREINTELVLVRQHKRIREFELERAEFRQQLLNIHADILMQKIEDSESVLQLNALQRQYFWSNDAQSAIVRRIRSGVSYKKREFLPLEPGEGNDYLNALYGEDFATLQKLDKAYARNSGLLSTLREYDAEVLIPWHKSLLPIVMASYLVDYQYRYKSCLKQHSVPHKSSAVSQLVYDHSWSDSQFLGPNPEQIEYFTVKAEFSFVFNAIGLTNNDSLYAKALEKLYTNESSMPTIVSRSTRTMMSDHDCRSAFIAKMEQGMMRYFKFLEQAH